MGDPNSGNASEAPVVSAPPSLTLPLLSVIFNALFVVITAVLLVRNARVHAPALAHFQLPSLSGFSNTVGGAGETTHMVIVILVVALSIMVTSLVVMFAVMLGFLLCRVPSGSGCRCGCGCQDKNTIRRKYPVDETTTTEIG